jgi:hypothetical protein
MGNWRTVRVVGECPEFTEQKKLHAALAVGYMDEKWDCLCSGGMCGLPNFGGKSEFNVVGNLGERGYEPECVAKHLRELVKIAPSLRCMIHCGDDYESTKCVATIVAVDGVVEVVPAQVDDVGEIPRDRIERNTLIAMLGGRPG